MRVVIAPDSFKGSVSATDAAAAMARGVLAVWPDAQVVQVPIADGGEGTVEAMVSATGGRYEETRAMGPLGEPVLAKWGVLGDGRTAVVETAAASGLPLVPPSKRDPRFTTTRGTGELLRAALDKGLRKVVLGLGGSATTDGGAGLLRALGVRFLDANEHDLAEGGAALAGLARVDLSGFDPRVADLELLVACDVDNPLNGPRGAAAVYGPQKGATPAMIPALDAALLRFAQVSEAATGRSVAHLPGAGASGGMGAGLMLFTPARLLPGVGLVLEAVGFDALLEGADLVITGEGRTDGQTAQGKAPVGVAAAAQRRGVPVICLSGGLGPGADDVLSRGIAAVASACPEPMALGEAMDRAAALLEGGAARACRLVRLGMSLR
jgi:glycerate kinase